MKVKNVNASSRRTKEAIRNAFAELLFEKKELQYVTVTELVKRAQITRSSFYTHYESIYDVAKELQDDTMDLLLGEDLIIASLEDIYTYIDNLTNIVKENESFYRMLLSSNEQFFFFEKAQKIFVTKGIEILKEFIDDDYLELKLNFFIDGVFLEITKHFRSNNYYTLDELNMNVKKWFKKLFV